MAYSVRDSAGRERSCDSSRLRADRRHGVIGPGTRIRREGSETWRNVEAVATQQGWDDDDVAARNEPRVTTALTPLPDDLDASADHEALDWRSREVDRMQQAAAWAEAAGIPPVPRALQGSPFLSQEAILDNSFEPTPVTPHRISALDPTYPAQAERLRAQIADWALPLMLGAVVALMTVFFAVPWWLAGAVGYAVAVIFGGLRLALWEWRYATTPGKRHFHIEVVGSSYLPVSPNQALWRNFVRWVCLVVPPLAVIDVTVWLINRQRCLHDIWSRTGCIRSAGVRPRSQEPARLLPSDWLRVLTRQRGNKTPSAAHWTSGSQFPSDPNSPS